MKRKVQALALVVCLALSCTACGKKNPDDIGEEMEQIDNEQGGEQINDEQEKEANVQSLKNMLAVDEEKWVESITVGEKTVSIDAKVNVPDVECMKVISMDEWEMDGDNKKLLLEKLCTQPYVFDETNPPQWYIDNNMERMESLEKAYYAQEYDPADEEYYKEQIDKLKGWRERKAGEFKNQISENYEEAEYYGEYKGHTYSYFFSEDIRGYMSWTPADCNGLSHYQPISGNCYYSISVTGDELESADNHCEMSEEDAVKVAEEFLGNLGYTGLIADTVNVLAWGDYENTIEDVEASGGIPFVDGYMITFYKGIDGIVLDNSVLHESMVERYEIGVTDAGVIAGSIQCPYVEGQVLSESTKLLSYQQVKDIFVSLISSDESYLRDVDSNLNFNAMVLSYYLVEENDTYALVPVWRLEDQYITYNVYTQEDEVQWVNMTIMINAIDGSVIDLKTSEQQ